MLPPETTIVFQSHRKRDCAERALVLQAMDIPHGMQADGNVWFLWTHETHVEQALKELHSYETDKAGEHERPKDPPVLSYGPGLVFGYALVIGLFFPMGMYGFLGQNFWLAGRMDSGLVAEGQLWRPITSLCLHADIGHLAGNLFFGALFGALTSQLIGGGLTWLLTLLAGTAGNFLTTWINGPGHLAVGASTAVFGTLGLFTFYELVRRVLLRGSLPPAQRFRIIAPLLAGVGPVGIFGHGRRGRIGPGGRALPRNRFRLRRGPGLPGGLGPLAPWAHGPHPTQRSLDHPGRDWGGLVGCPLELASRTSPGANQRESGAAFP